MAFLNNVSDIIFVIKCFQNSHGGLLPQKIVMSPETYIKLKTEVEEKDEVWNDDYFGVPIEIDATEADYHLIGAVRLPVLFAAGQTEKKTLVIE